MSSLQYNMHVIALYLFICFNESLISEEVLKVQQFYLAWTRVIFFYYSTVLTQSTYNFLLSVFVQIQED